MRPEAPRGIVGEILGTPPRNFGEPRKNSASTHKICSRIRAGNAVGPPTTSNLYDLLMVSPKTKLRLGKLV